MTIRSFIAIKIPDHEEYNSHLTRASKSLDVKFKLINPLNYHLTLHFFGDIEPLKIERIVSDFQELNFDPFPVSLTKQGYFPSNKPHKARILYRVISLSPELASLHSKVQNIVGQLGFKRDRLAFKPHLTVARIRKGKDVNKLATSWKNIPNFDPFYFQCEYISLFESKLTPKGALYTEIARFGTSQH